MRIDVLHLDNIYRKANQEFFGLSTRQYVDVGAKRTETVLIEINGLNFRPLRPYQTMAVF